MLSKLRRDKVIIRLTGGLGNQLFQFSYGQYLKKHHNIDVIFDVQFYLSKENEKLLRKFSLIELGFRCPISGKLKSRVWSGRSRSLLARFLKKYLWKNPVYLYEFYSENFDVFNIMTPAYIEGGFQRSEIVIDVLEDMRNMINPTIKLSPIYFQWLKRIQKSNSVAIHVRRGDYINNKSTNALHGVCTFDYYVQAINKIIQEQSDVNFFVFSDDLEYCRLAFSSFESFWFVDISSSNQNHSDLEEFLLLVKCKHQIIANSTFSWWAAMLNNNPSKLVIYPLRWFSEGRNSDVSQLLHVDSWKAV